MFNQKEFGRTHIYCISRFSRYLGYPKKIKEMLYTDLLKYDNNY